MTEYFNILTSGLKGASFAFFGVPFIIIGFLGLTFLKNYQPQQNSILNNNKTFNPRPLRIFLRIWTGFAILVTSISVLFIFGEYYIYKSVMRNNEYSVIEGYVTNFEPMPYSGHKKESFTVEGIKFEYSDFIGTCGFNNTKSHGGPIDEGKYVKIFYNDGKILRLLVRDN